MNAWEFFDRHFFGVCVVLVLIWPSFKLTWRRECKQCAAAKEKAATE